MYTSIVFIPTSGSIVKNTVITQYLRTFLLVFNFYSVCNKAHYLFISAIFKDINNKKVSNSNIKQRNVTPNFKNGEYEVKCEFWRVFYDFALRSKKIGRLFLITGN